MSQKEHLSPDQVVARLASMSKLSPEQVRALLQAQAELACEQARVDYPIPGVGVLHMMDMPARSMVMQFGPKKGQTVEIPAKKKLTFRVCKMLKDVVFGNPKSIADLFEPEDLKVTW